MFTGIDEIWNQDLEIANRHADPDSAVVSQIQQSFSIPKQVS